MFGLPKLVVLALAISAAQAAPIHKRIAQTIPASTQKWEAACRTAGGGEKCNSISVTAFSTLLAAAGPCEQQNAADSMIDLAKQLNNDAEMIRLAQIFRQQPRNTPTSESVQYCQQAPKNSELSGLFQCQFAGAKTDTFVGGIPVGSPGTIPFGLSTPLNPAGSCPASLDTPVPDGQQLVDLTQDPGPGSGAGDDEVVDDDTPVLIGNPPDGPSCDDLPAEDDVGEDDTTPEPEPAVPEPSTGDFRLKNGQDAQKLNVEFATLTADSSCTDGQNACVGEGFAQCVGGKFLITQCNSSLVCAVLPLVNSPGTSITCTTKEDAIARIANSGALGGFTGSD